MTGAVSAAADPGLIDAVKRGDTTAVRTLVAKKADVNAAAVDTSTALHWAVYDQNPDLIRMLIAAGADITARTSQGYTAMDIAKIPVYAPNDTVTAALQEAKR